MLEYETSALVLYDGMIWGWFTGRALPAFFDKEDIEDPVNARQIVNGLGQGRADRGLLLEIQGRSDMTLGGAANEAIKGLSGQPMMLLVAVLNVLMIGGLLYVAREQKEERATLMQGLIDNVQEPSVIEIIIQNPTCASPR